ncbi:MAG: hypothetical protein WBD40_00430, partial [Tepidisphaeraceae bacterium]
MMVTLLRLAIVACTLPATARVATGADLATAPSLPPGKPLIDGSPRHFQLMGSAVAMAEAKVVDVRGPGGFTRAWRVDVRDRAKEPWAIQLAATVAGDAPKRGDVVLLSVWARTLRATDETNAGTIGLVLEQSDEPFAKTLSAQFSVGKDWQRFDVPAKVEQDYAKSRPRVAVRLGFAPQTIEVGGV